MTNTMTNINITNINPTTIMYFVTRNIFQMDQMKKEAEEACAA